MPAAITTEKIITRAIEIHGDKYDYSMVDYKPGNKIVIICKIHGQFVISPDHHINRGQGCSLCGRIKRGIEQRKGKATFIKDAVSIHGDSYDYSKVVYSGNKKLVDILCKKHKILFRQSPISHIRGCGCPECGKEKRVKSKSKPVSIFVQQAISVHGNKYSYDLTSYKNASSAVRITCNSCKNVFLQRAFHHIGGSGCPKCADVRGAKLRSLTASSFLVNSRVIHGNKYDYADCKYVDYMTPVRIFCKHCGDYFDQVPKYHLVGKGCPSCGKDSIGKFKVITYAAGIKRAQKTHKNRYAYGNEPIDYNGIQSKIEIVCAVHGVFTQVLEKHIGGQGCPACINRISKGEIELLDWIKSLGVVAYKDNSILPRQELDIYMPEYKFAIEYNGIYYHCESRGRGGKYHLNKRNAAETAGVHLMQFWNIEWVDKKDIVKSIILNKLRMPKFRLFARKLCVRDVSTKDARIFCVVNHLHGFRGGKVYKGLYDGDTLVSIMITAADGEMVRYVVQNFTTVVGGFSKLLKYSPVTYSFVDKRIFTGEGYAINGFKKVSDTPPNYYYTKTYRDLESRNKYQKHKLECILPFYNPTITEVQNMAEHGFDRIFDCGHLHFKRL